MQKYNLITHNGYPLVKIDDNTFLIDTGCQCSVAFHPFKKVEINGLNCLRYFQYFPGLPSLNDMMEAFGQSIDGFIGVDILKLFHICEIDLLNNTVLFGSSDKPREHSFQFNDLQIEVSLNGKKAYGYLDTGAPLIMVENDSLIDETKYIGKVQEQTNSGTFILDKYKATFEIAGVKKEVNILKHKKGMLTNHSDLYFGLSQICEEFYVFDLEEHICYFK